MNQPTELDLNSEWENIVNNVKRRNTRTQFLARLRKRELMKRIGKMLNFALGAVLCIVLGIAGLLAPWLAGTAGILSFCVACFLGGRIWEARKR